MGISSYVREDCLMITFDSSELDDTLLVVSRCESDGSINVLRTFKNEEAWYMYNRLLGNF